MAHLLRRKFGSRALTAVLLTVLSTAASFGSVIYVRTDGDDGNSGLGWAAAKKTIQAAVDVAAVGDDIWVARGRYREQVRLSEGIRLYGGFAGLETSIGSRDWVSNPVTIEADSGNALTAQSDNVVDGFTIADSTCGVYCNSSPTLMNNSIVGNSYAVYCDLSGSPVIIANRITGNSQAIYVAGDSSPRVQSNVIAGNNTAFSSYGVGTPILTNNTIAGNGTGLYFATSGSAAVANNIIAFNGTGVYAQDEMPSTGINDVFGNTENYTGSAVHGANVSFDPLFASLQFGNFHLQPASGCRDAGDNSPDGGLPDMDIDGQIRIQDGKVDLGADEYNGHAWPTGGRTLYVRSSAPSGGNGTSWTTAYQTVQAAVADALECGGAEIWVAGGTYGGNIQLVPFAHLYGGFTGTEDRRDDRRLRDNPAVIDGDGSGSVVTGWNISTVDGFTIRNGDYGIYCNTCSPGIRNNTLTGLGNTGIYLATTSAVVANNTLYGNGSGICCLFGAPIVVNNTISGNGTALANWYATTTAANNIVAFNQTGVSSTSDSLMTLLRNDVYENNLDYSGLEAGHSDISENPRFVNVEAGDYHLSADSPCIDRGHMSALGITRWDMDGEVRTCANVDIGADEFWPTVLPPSRLKCLADGASVDVDGVVTAVFTDSFYVENADRSSGIRIAASVPTTLEGMPVSVEGLITTDAATGERQVTPGTISPGGPTPSPVRPVGMPNRLVGGRDWYHDANDGRGQEGVLGGSGLNNIGLLIRTWGAVVEMDSAEVPTWFRIDDSICDGLKVVVPADVAVDDAWGYVTVTGISSCERSGEDLIRVLRVRRQSDIQMQD